MSPGPDSPPPPRARPPASGRALAFARHHLLTVYGVLALGSLLLPIVVVVAFSFNDPPGRFNYTWAGFTLESWTHPLGVPAIGDAITTSLEVAAIATVCATVLGTLIAMALVRYGFRGRGLTNFLIFMPISTPEIVLGASLLTLFLNFGVQLGFWTIVIAHIAFNISFVVVTVKARLVDFDLNLEDAAADLYAPPLQTFRYVTLPLIAPAILAGGLLAFALSFDEVIVTTFTAGPDQTLPIWILANLSRPNQLPIVNVVAVFVILLSMIPVYAASKLSSESQGAGATAGRD
jgi:spermidine/putrescine transport system permease protein